MPEQTLPSPAEQPRVADVLMSALLEQGVDTFYGIPGGAICSVYDALIDLPRAKLINTRHESGAAFMAMGHWRASNRMAAVLMTSGPGITNAITGLAAAYADNVPLIAIGGEVPRSNFGRGALQEGSSYELDVVGMVRSVTKMAAEITNPRAAVNVMRKAVATALSGRQGPVFLSVPLDAANQRVPVTRASSHVETKFQLDASLVNEVVAALQGSRRGLILVGSGARHPSAVEKVATLARILQMPVATTPKGKGLFPESSPLSLGIFGFGGHPSAMKYLEGGVDTLLCIGCGLGETGTNSWSPLLKASQAFIQIDIDGAQIGRNYHADFGLIGPAHLVLDELIPKLKPLPPSGQPIGGIAHLELESRSSQEGALHPVEAIQGLQKLLPENTIFTSDIGEHTIFALHCLKSTRPDSFLVGTGLGSMGSGLGMAIGAKQACPTRPVVSIVGDYGFQMFGMELVTCVQSRIGTVFAVFNDARMRMVESGLERIFGRTGNMAGPRMDFAAFARSTGATGFNIKSLKDLMAVPPSALSGELPCVLDISIDPKAFFPMHGRVAHLKNFAG